MAEGRVGRRPASSRSIPASYSRLVAQELGLHPRDLPLLLAGTSLTPAMLWDDSTRLTADEQIQALQNALDLSGDDHFGLRLGRRLTPAAHGPMGYLASSSPDLGTAVEAIAAFLPIRMSFVQLDLSRSGDDLLMECAFHAETTPEVQRCLAEVCAMTFFACAEFIIGRPATEGETHFTHPDPGPRTAVSDYLPGRVRYGCRTLAVRLPLQVCEIPNASANHESAEIARAQCEAILADLRGSGDSYRRQVETMMLAQTAGKLTEEVAAEALFMSKRTLARRLKQEGTSFRQIQQEILARQATSYLRDGRLTVDAIAALLHFHDSANFRRAFKGWLGMTPEQYRSSAAR